MTTANNMDTQVELGGYVGYSCILFGDSLRKAGGYRYYSIEMNPEFAAVIMSLVDPAGLSDIVTVIVGDAWPSLLQLYVGGVRQIDLLFLDHYKPAYASDLKLAEDYGFIKPGSVVVANDVVKRGTNSPAYLFWVRSGMRPKWKIVLGKADLEKTCAKEHGTAMKQYGKKCGISKMTQSTGDPGLVYEGGLVESFEPTGKLVCDQLVTERSC